MSEKNAFTLPARDWDDDPAARERAYTPSTCVDDLTPFLREYAARSATAREALRWHALSYGSDAAEVCHFFPAARPGAPLHVFIHGGYWQELSEAESSFAARDFVAAGAAFAALGYGLAPRHRLDEIVAMVRRAVLWLHRHVGELGVRPGGIFLSGSSAGAHLAAMCLPEGWLPTPLRPTEVIGGATLLSGVYELEPLLGTGIGESIGLTAGEVISAGPIRQLPSEFPPVLVARGANETAAFADQQDLLVGALTRLGAPVTDLVVPDRNHFDLPLEIADPGTALGWAVLAHMGLAATTQAE